jgi:hypothetical protein
MKNGSRPDARNRLRIASIPLLLDLGLESLFIGGIFIVDMER